MERRKTAVKPIYIKTTLNYDTKANKKIHTEVEVHGTVHKKVLLLWYNSI